MHAIKKILGLCLIRIPEKRYRSRAKGHNFRQTNFQVAKLQLQPIPREMPAFEKDASNKSNFFPT